MVVVEVVLLLQVDQVVQEEEAVDLVEVQNQVVVEFVAKVFQVELCPLTVLAVQVVEHLKQVLQELLLVLLFLQELMALVEQEQVMI